MQYFIMQYFIRFLVVTCCAIAGAQGGLAQTERRVALVVGNSAYQHTRALPNPKNDAEAIAKLLRESGFADVTLRNDLDYRAMREVVRAFAQAAREADVALVYYGGHGLEVAGQNYLVPTDAKLERDADLEYEVVALASVMNAAANARRLRLVILDACRNNPLGERMQLAGGITRSVSRGLARIEPHRNVLVAYAAKEGTVAQDGAGQHSPYAEALMKHMATPGLDVRLMFGKVRDHVLAATRQEQEPYTYGSLSGDVVPLVPGAALTKAQQVELELWTSVKDSTSPAVLRTYLERYEKGEFAPIVRALIEHYERREKAELAEREEASKRQEEERIAAAVKQIERERREREAALAEERKRAEEGKNSDEAKLVDEKQRAEWLARTEELRKLTEQMKQASEALAASEKQRLAAVKAAEDARKAAEETIATKREAEKTGNAAKLAALPKIDVPPPVRAFEGTWYLRRLGPGCRTVEDVRMVVHVANGVVSGRGPVGPITGTVSATGQLRFGHGSWFGPQKAADGFRLTYQGSLRGNGGSGTFSATRSGSTCSGTFTATRG